jgi:co-chaperonin GroES (HSP10)
MNDVVVMEREDANTHVGRFEIPPKYRKSSARGTVVDVGPNVKDINVGDVYLFREFAGMKVMLNKFEFTILRPHELLVKEHKDVSSRTT